MSVPRLIVSTGEPAGIGPDIMLLAAQHQFDADIITVGDPVLFQQRADALNININIETASLSDKRKVTDKGTLKVLPVKLKRPVVTGQLDEENARYVLDVLDVTILACQSGEADGLVTGPIQKSILNHINPNFSGHTEYLAEKTAAELPVMMLATQGLRVALVTTHVPLAQVAAMITKKRVTQIIEILAHDLKTQFGIQNPKILVTGLNPHAGENGHLGTEEQEVIEPVIKQFQSAGLDISGPFPADTLFTPKYLENADAVLAMYHDQGLPVLKYKGFGNAINVTLGLSITRTSVDHGTALELAGTGDANPQSMLLAIQSALDIVKSRNR
ncbi:MAG: 4-hydroxythreonine-4-phosphate dehydrogenase PdxA [Gammaproteobacteria bacterium]|nr:4-hydroxythreonine-4-phosphate dehydrogenase PdxA [Gammaproteobacteria bacterium]